MESIVGTLSYMLYSTKSGWGIAKIRTNEKTVSAKGMIAGLTRGITNEFLGEWEDTKYGKTFKVSSYHEKLPDHKDGVVKYMASRFKGIGKKTAERIYDVYGNDSIEIICENPEALQKVKGISKKAIEGAKEFSCSNVRLHSFLASNGISVSLCGKIEAALGKTALSDIKTNPYILMKVAGIGFVKADRMARSMGIKADSPFRLKAALEYILQAAGNEGHMFLPREELANRAYKLTGYDCDREIDAISVIEDNGIYPKGRYFTEVNCARRIHELSGRRRPAMNAEIEDAEKTLCITYDESQKDAIRNALGSGFSVITGGPGVGKTTVLRGILHIILKRKQKPVLCAPTGKAAKRMKEATSYNASTIHRLLGWSEGEFEHNQKNPLSGTVLIVDESSMIDTWLMNSLLNAAGNMQVILVGDADQLPSVGPGNVLHDIIESNCVPVTHLNHIHRQKENSSIVEMAHQINEGKMPDLSNKKDFTFIECTSVSQAQSEAVQATLVNQSQVLTPVHRSSVGTDSLNAILSSCLNPDGESVREGERPLRTGDRVMQTRNDYSKGVFNGDSGKLLTKNIVMFDGEKKEFKELGSIEESYAITIHKAQGSEYDEAVIIMPKCRMNYRNLLYTAITRCKRNCILISTREAVERCVTTTDPMERYTGLSRRIRKEFR